VPAVSGDLDGLWKLWRRRDVRRYLFDDAEVTRELAAEVLAGCLAEATAGRGLWIVHERAAATTIGCVALMLVGSAAEHDPTLAGLVEPMAALEPAWWGRGFATEALAALLAHAFGALDLPRIAGVTDVPNEGSHRMLLRLGFVVRGEREGPCHRIRTYLLERPNPLEEQ
jgi:ribosomal-protein-alanine N-acetyltransferase